MIRGQRHQAVAERRGFLPENAHRSIRQVTWKPGRNTPLDVPRPAHLLPHDGHLQSRIRPRYCSISARSRAAAVVSAAESRMGSGRQWCAKISRVHGLPSPMAAVRRCPLSVRVPAWQWMPFSSSHARGEKRSDPAIKAGNSSCSLRASSQHPVCSFRNAETQSGRLSAARAACPPSWPPPRQRSIPHAAKR